jgi:hypothetical protein
MSDLTTTMPILVVPPDDSDAHSAPPGEPGHFHTDDGSGRHRGGSRMPRGLIVTFGVAVVAGIGLVASGMFDGGSSSNGSGVAQSAPTGGPTTPGDPTPSGGAAQGPNDQASADASGASQSATPTHTRTSTKPRPTTAAPTPTSAANATQSAPPARPTSAPTTQFQPLSQGMTGQAVSDMQHLLEQHGYLSPGSYQDGTFDSSTYFAVRQVQRNHQGTSAADGKGIYGAATRDALLSEVPPSG